LYGAVFVPGLLFFPVLRETKMSFADKVVIAVNAIITRKDFFILFITSPYGIFIVNAYTFEQDRESQSPALLTVN
jgi:uncharacterized membrane protein